MTLPQVQTRTAEAYIVENFSQNLRNIADANIRGSQRPQIWAIDFFWVPPPGASAAASLPDMPPLILTDAELGAVFNAARPLAPNVRQDFLE